MRRRGWGYHPFQSVFKDLVTGLRCPHTEMTVATIIGIEELHYKA